MKIKERKEKKCDSLFFKYLKLKQYLFLPLSGKTNFINNNEYDASLYCD